mgnify:CR=1 FL=1
MNGHFGNAKIPRRALGVCCYTHSYGAALFSSSLSLWWKRFVAFPFPSKLVFLPSHSQLSFLYPTRSIFFVLSVFLSISTLYFYLMETFNILFRSIAGNRFVLFFESDFCKRCGDKQLLCWLLRLRLRHQFLNRNCLQHGNDSDQFVYLQLLLKTVFPPLIICSWKAHTVLTSKSSFWNLFRFSMS